jgi:hypothetical protein
MKKSLVFALILSMVFLLTGCGQKFEPTESTIFVNKKGIVQSAVRESFEKSYYDFDELYKAVEKEVKSYCLDKNEESVSIISLTEENEEVTLMMEFQSVDDYTEFNEVLLFAGTFAEAVDAGYMPGTLLDAEGEMAEIDLEEQGDLQVIVTEESVCVQTSGKIQFVSDNVSVLDKKLAKALEAGKAHPAFVLYK